MKTDFSDGRLTGPSGKSPVYTRSTLVSLKFNNRNRLDDYHGFINEYRRVASLLMDGLWRDYGFSSGDFSAKPGVFIKKDVWKRYGIETWLGSRPSQCVGKQVLGIIRGCVRKQQKRGFLVDKFKKEGKFLKARKLRRLMDEVSIGKPSTGDINPLLSEQCVKEVHLDDDPMGLCWLNLRSLRSKDGPHSDGAMSKMDLCFKRHKHWNTLVGTFHGTLNHSVELQQDAVKFSFSCVPVNGEKSDNVVGIDVGVKKVLSCSTGATEPPDGDGWTMDKITERISRRKRGSKGYARAMKLRDNHTNFVIKRMGLEHFRAVVREDIKNLRRGKRSSKKLSSFNYHFIFNRLDGYLSLHGVRVETVNPRYTSQRCSVCGYVRKGNRSGEKYVCSECGSVLDADVNASRNIALKLRPLTEQECVEGRNIEGFYWNPEKVWPSSGESIVPRQIKSLQGRMECKHSSIV